MFLGTTYIRKRFIIWFSLLVIGWSISVLSADQATQSPETTNKGVYIPIVGAIGPATKDYVVQALQKARKIGASLFIIQMDTPGGLETSMRDINQAILASPIPVVTYVAPSGARAASAGTYILYASNIAAMAPATNLGAATPVQIGGMEFPGKPSGQGDKEQQPPSGGKERQEPASQPSRQQKPVGESGGSTMERKVTNDAVAYIRSLAELRGRNVEWAEKAVREAASLSAQDALKLHVIDLIAADMSDLLKKLDGRKVEVSGREVFLDTQGMILEKIEPNWRTRLLSILTDPNVAYILMLIGIYGIIFEFVNPGSFIPGVMGGICLLLALYAFQVLPINYAGLGLILLGIILMVAEAFVPSFGALGIGGVVSFVIGSIILMDTDVPGFGISVPLIGSVALISSALFVIVLVMALKARRRPVVSGQEELIGATGEVLSDFQGDGFIRTHGENWSAHCETPLRKGQKVKVVKRDGLILWIEPQESSKEELP